jgi:polysaccharide deacetylase 2 family uncharacterized protein YibQ
VARLTPRLAWIAVGGLVLVLAAGIVALDRHQAQRGAPSLLGLRWTDGAGRPVAAGPAARRSASPAGSPGRIAVIVDELGGRADVLDRLIALGQPLTVAIQPGLPLARTLARTAARAGLEVMVQLPLEPYRFPEADPGPGVLLSSMPFDEVTRRARQQLASVPGAVGVVTRMGSRFTEDRARMRALLEPVFLQGLYFVDSLTSQRSVGYDVALALGIPAARRQVFLDPDEREATIRARLADAASWAERRGAVVAIGHGRLLTVRLLEEAVSAWEARGLRLVPVSAVIGREASSPRAAT